MRKLSLLVVLLAFPAAAEARPYGQIVTTANQFQVAGVFNPDGEGDLFWPAMQVGDVATGDVNGDGTDELIFGSGVLQAPRVIVLDGKTRAIIRTINPYGSTGGTRVAAGDFN